VDVDVKANHLRWFEDQPPTKAEAGSEEGAPLLEALETMPAFDDPDESTPMWQVLVSRRKVAFHVHHIAVDGIGVAIIASTLFLGLGLEDTLEQMFAKETSKIKEALPSGPCTCCGEIFGSIRSFFAHIAAPFAGLCCPKRSSAISSTDGEAEVPDIRYLHLGPYKLSALRANAKENGVTVNSVLLSAVTSGVQDYCAACGDDDSQITVAIPVNFKRPSSDEHEGMRANNDFATMIVDIPAQGKEPLESSLVRPRLHLLPLTALSRAHAVGAWAAQAILSLLPKCLVGYLVLWTSHGIHMIFSNVNGSAFGDTFVSSATGARKKIHVYAYGAMNASVRLFLLANSHGDDVHLGLTLDSSVVSNRAQLAACLDRQVRAVCSGSP